MVSVSENGDFVYPQICAVVLSEKIYYSLKKQILSGEIKPGQFITETNLARNFSVSRTPVREALSVIQKEVLLIYRQIE